MARKKKRTDGRYQGKVLIGHDTEGKALFKFVYAKTQAELDEKKQEVKEEIMKKKNRTSIIDADTYPLSDWLTHWQDNVVKGKVRQNTWESYECVIQLHLIPHLGQVPIGKLQPPAIREFYAERKVSGNKGKPLSDRRVKYIHIVLNAALQQAVIDGVIDKNPCIIIKGSTKKIQKKKEINVFTQEQINKILTEAKGWLHLILFIAWGTGLRREELLGLRWQDINIKKSTLSVNQAVIVTREFGPQIEAPKNESSYRTIPVPKEIIKEIQQYKPVVNEQRLKTGIMYQDNDLIFPKADGTPRDPRQLSKDFKKIIKKLALPDKLHLHDLRHTHATQLLEFGVHPKVVQYRLGHSTFQQTMDTYSHVIPQMQDGIGDMLSGLLVQKKEKTEA